MENIRKGSSVFTDSKGNKISLKRGYYWAISLYSPDELFVIELRGDSVLACGSGFYMHVDLFLENYRLIRRIFTPKITD